MTHPLSEQVDITYDGLTEAQYIEETRPMVSRVALLCIIGMVALLVISILGTGFARAETPRDTSIPAAAIAPDATATYPGGDPSAELEQSWRGLVFSFFGGSSSSLGTQPIQPPQGDLPLLDDPQSVLAFCDGDQTTIQVAGIAPVSGLYRITYTPTPEMTFTLFEGYLEKGEKVRLVEPAPAGATVVVALQLPAAPDDTASLFVGALAVPTPVCG